MQTVSNAFKTEINSSYRKPRAKVVIDFHGNFIDKDVTPVVSGTKDATNTPAAQACDGILYPHAKWALFGRAKFDGTFYFCPSNGERQMGWHNQTRCSDDANRNWTSSPTYELQYTTSRTINRVEVIFEPKLGHYAEDFLIEAYYSASWHTVVSVTGNTLSQYSYDMSPQLSGVSKIKLTISKWSLGDSYAKVVEFDAQFAKEFTTEKIESLRIFEERDFSEGTLPVGNASANECDLVLDNTDNAFFKDNSNSEFYGMLKDNRRIRPYLGFAVFTDDQVWEVGYSITSIFGQEWRAQTFYAGGNGRLKLFLKMRKYGSPPENLVIELRNRTADNLPGTIVYAAKEYLPSQITTSFVVYNFDLGEVVEGNHYAFVLYQKNDGGGIFNSYEVQYEYSVGGYTGGRRCSSSNAGSTWTGEDNLDFYFKTQVEKTEYVPKGVFFSRDWKCPNLSPTVSINALDRAKWLMDMDYAVSQVQMEKTIKWLVEKILADAGLSSYEYQVDDITTVIPYYWSDKVKVWTALKKLAAACGAVMYFDENGIFRFESRDHLFSSDHLVSQATIEDTMNLFRCNPDVLWAPTKNKIKIKSKPLAAPSAPSEIYSFQEEDFVLAPNETKTIDLFYSSSPCIEVATPVVTANPATVTVTTWTAYAYGGHLVITNTGGAASTVSAITIQGKPLAASGEIISEAKDTTLIAEQGEKLFELSNDYVQKSADALAYANDLLASYKDSGKDLELEYRGNPALQLGDRITIIDAKSSLNADYHIIRHELDFDGGLKGKILARKVT